MVFSAHPGLNRQVRDVSLRHGKKRNAAMDATEEKIIPRVQVNPLRVLVNAHGQKVFLAEFQLRGEVSLKRVESALMKIGSTFAGLIRIDGLAVAKYFGAVLHAVKVKFDHSTFPLDGRVKLQAI